MLKRLTLSETDTFEEVNKALNNLIDNINLIESKVIDDDIEAEKKAKKKGGK